MWFKKHPIFGNEFISTALNKQVRGGEWAIRGLCCWKHFRQFMCMFDFRRNIKQETAKNPLFKVQHLLDELNENAVKMWIPGKWLAIDEQTLGFQGRSGLKLRISYKSEGNGFQCDAVCDDGYTFLFYFRHGDAPPSLISSRKKSLTYPQQRRELFGLPSISQTSGPKFTWIIYSTLESYLPPSTWRRLSGMVWFVLPDVDFLPL